MQPVTEDLENPAKELARPQGAGNPRISPEGGQGQVQASVFCVWTEETCQLVAVPAAQTPRMVNGGQRRGTWAQAKGKVGRTQLVLSFQASKAKTWLVLPMCYLSAIVDLPWWAGRGGLLGSLANVTAPGPWLPRH